MPLPIFYFFDIIFSKLYNHLYNGKSIIIKSILVINRINNINNNKWREGREFFVSLLIPKPGRKV